MNSAQQQRTVERYLNGELTPSEEQDFFIEVAVNDELRQRLKANRIVDQALARDSKGVNRDHSRMRSQLLALHGAALSGGAFAARHRALHRVVRELLTWKAAVVLGLGGGGALLLHAIDPAPPASVPVSAPSNGGVVTAPQHRDPQPTSGTDHAVDGFDEPITTPDAASTDVPVTAGPAVTATASRRHDALEVGHPRSDSSMASSTAPADSVVMDRQDSSRIGATTLPSDHRTSYETDDSIHIKGIVLPPRIERR